MIFSCVLASLTIHRLVAALGKGLNESAKIKQNVDVYEIVFENISKALKKQISN